MPRELREVWNQKMSIWQCDGSRQAMMVTIMKLQCYIYTYRNLCVCICGRWGGERGKCRNTINFSNLHRYLPSWHIYSQTTRNVLQIRVINNFLCLCQRPQPHAPARSSSPSTELRVRLCCLSSVHSLKDTHFPHHSSYNSCFLLPLHDHLLGSLFLPASFSSVPLTATDPHLISLTAPCISAYISQNCHSSAVMQKKWCPCASCNLKELFLPLAQSIPSCDSSLLLPPSILFALSCMDNG